MASGGSEWSCPICCKVPGDVAHALPCHHEFCLGCILRWLRGKRTCPLCRRVISTIRFSEQEEDCLQCTVRQPREATSHAGNTGSSRDEPSTYGFITRLASASQGTPSPAEQGAARPEAVGGILPELWAELFQRRRNLLNPVRSWLQQWLQKIYGKQWWQIKSVKSGILLALCIFGPEREVLVQHLQPCLRHHTALIVEGIFSIVETQCSQEVRRLRGCHAAQEEAESPRASSDPLGPPGDAPTSGGPPDSSREHEADASEEALERSPSTCGTIPAEPEQP
ncbi:hypothetical protein DUI87_22207 [Hirundo rustica rustica]|uniref:RING-type E3 ubiquitin transferase n=1 Tax=Hirundo rustica rustica TaxID=333673 RepID=A0A3M0JJE2_HIRRU|nr:hypothetical protein DUI87_22207 [Hirundo rustica rustica]